MAKDPKKYKRKKKLGSYHYGSVIFSCTLALFVIGLFGMLLLQTNRLTKIIQENVELQIYLDKNTSDNQRSRIENELSSSEYILRKDGQAQITFVSKEEAASQFISDTGEDFSDFLGDNPLRDAITIKVDPQFQENEQLESIKSSIENISGVYEVTYIENLIDSINSNLTKLSAFLIGLAVVLFLIVLLLINNAIKLALFSQRFLIRSMQLVGAKGGFIKSPFLNRSLLHGAIAGVVASVLLYGLRYFANEQIDGLALLQQQELIYALFGLLVIVGAFMSYFSTLRAINKYLKMSLDELY